MAPEDQQERVRSSFAKQGLMTTLGATLGRVSPEPSELAFRFCRALIEYRLIGFATKAMQTRCLTVISGTQVLPYMSFD